ncbi:methylamine utilization protein [Natronospira bacteriovora]|uniref:Methylamine utilization protein n=1 Tax=Natronospira bacteriovora TaxID=3069753 RepID=A0ABU0W8D1_9GAMM|nr:methylamine utilization protein [Natronospira sp. AB-CW4]MDQ2069715.1 methylamine utilization protein [Natronospira sp. AB-CW4]
MSRSTLPLLSTILGLALMPGQPIASNLTLELSAESGDISETLVSLQPVDADTEVQGEDLAKMDQIDRQFSPRAIAIKPGSHVRFLNNDDVRHHVYSFSAAKRFELPLFKGDPPEDIHFEKTGEVVLGCNIHDWMVGWVHVMETPYFGFADNEGQITLEVPPGEYELVIWHPDATSDSRRVEETIRITEDGVTLERDLELTPAADDQIDRRRRRRF